MLSAREFLSGVMSFWLAEFVTSVLLFLAIWLLFKGVSLLHLLTRGQVRVISVPNISAIGQHNLNPRLKNLSLQESLKSRVFV